MWTDVLRRLAMLEEENQKLNMVVAKQGQQLAALMSESLLDKETLAEPRSDCSWHLDPNEQSQSVIYHDQEYYSQEKSARPSTTSYISDDDPPSPVNPESQFSDPYIPSYESQIEQAIIGGSEGKVAGRPPGVSPAVWLRHNEK